GRNSCAKAVPRRQTRTSGQRNARLIAAPRPASFRAVTQSLLCSVSEGFDKSCLSLQSASHSPTHVSPASAHPPEWGVALRYVCLRGQGGRRSRNAPVPPIGPLLARRL